MKEVLTYHANEYPDFEQEEYLFQYISERKLTSIPHKHTFYEMVYISSGSACHIINAHKTLMQTGDLVFLSPYDSHYFIDQSEKTAIISLSILPKRFEAITSALGLCPEYGHCYHISPLNFSDELLFTHLLPPTNKKISLNILLCKIITHLSDSILSTETRFIPSFLLNAITELNYPENLKQGLSFLIKKTGYSRSQLYRLIRQYCNVSPLALITDLRMNLAKELLTNTDKTLDSIAETIGYNSVSQFHNVFRKYVQCSPSAFRRRTQKHSSV